MKEHNRKSHVLLLLLSSNEKVRDMEWKNSFFIHGVVVERRSLLRVVAVLRSSVCFGVRRVSVFYTMSDSTVRVSDEQIFKIKLSLSSLSTSVILCPMLTSLYTKTTSRDDDTWIYLKKGVPGIILNHGTTSNKTTTTGHFSVELGLADPTTGFLLWKESVCVTSQYRSSQKNFHTFKTSEDTMAGLKFPLDEGANIFLHDVVRCIGSMSPVTDVVVTKKNDTNSKKTLRMRRENSKQRNKIDISTPCMFSHVTSFSDIQLPKKEEWKSISSSLEDIYRWFLTDVVFLCKNDCWRSIFPIVHIVFLCDVTNSYKK